MNFLKNYTLLIIPDDDRETNSIRFSSRSIKLLIFFAILLFIITISVFINFIPDSKAFYDLENKYQILISERSEVANLRVRLMRISKMDQYIRRSLGTELDLKEKINFSDSLLLNETTDNLSFPFSENIPNIIPTDGFISQSHYNEDSYTSNNHAGIDVVSKLGEPIVSSAKGLVVFSGWTYELGNLIIIYHGDDYFTLYGHNQINLKNQLEEVAGGDLIGLVGSTGISTGPHLHFEIWKNGTSIDPLKLFPSYKNYKMSFK
tara:strand:- start:349 stop:1134 length:786 start_codon:yes stop_codon:yes gene_type:complete